MNKGYPRTFLIALELLGIIEFSDILGFEEHLHKWISIQPQKYLSSTHRFHSRKQSSNSDDPVDHRP